MKKKSTPLIDIVRSIKTNTTLVLALAVILIVAAFIYVPAVQEELGAKPSEAGGITWGGDSSSGSAPDIGGPPDEAIPINWKPEGIKTTLLKADNKHSYTWGKIYENTLVYVRYDNATHDNDILMLDVSTQVITEIDTDAKMASMPQIYGNYIVYHKHKIGLSWDVYLYNITTQQRINLTNNPSNKSSYQTVIYENNVVFLTKKHNLDTGVFEYIDMMLYDISNPESLKSIKTFYNYQPIMSIGVQSLSMHKSYVLWEYRNKNTDKFNVSMIDLNNLEQPSVIIDPDPSTHQLYPDRYDNLIVWHTNQYSFGPRSVILFDLDTGKKIAITMDEVYDANEYPMIYDKLIAMRGFIDTGVQTQRVLIEKYNPLMYILFKDPPEYQIDSLDTTDQWLSDLYKNKVIYGSYKYDNPLTPMYREGSIYMFEITN